MVYKLVLGYRFDPENLVRYRDCEEEDRLFLIEQEFKNAIPNRKITVFPVPKLKRYVLGIALSYLTENQEILENSISLSLSLAENNLLSKIWGERKIVKNSEKIIPKIYFF